MRNPSCAIKKKTLVGKVSKLNGGTGVSPVQALPDTFDF